MESEIARINTALGKAGLFESSPGLFNELVKELERVEADKTAKEDEWLELEMLREELEEK